LTAPCSRATRRCRGRWAMTGAGGPADAGSVVGGHLSLWCLEQAALETIDRSPYLERGSQSEGSISPCAVATTEVSSAAASSAGLSLGTLGGTAADVGGHERSPRRRGMMAPLISGCGDGTPNSSVPPLQGGTPLRVERAKAEAEVGWSSGTFSCAEEVGCVKGFDAAVQAKVGAVASLGGILGEGSLVMSNTVSGLSKAADDEVWARLHAQLQSLHQDVQELSDSYCPVPPRPSEPAVEAAAAQDCSVISAGPLPHADGIQHGAQQSLVRAPTTVVVAAAAPGSAVISPRAASGTAVFVQRTLSNGLSLQRLPSAVPPAAPPTAPPAAPPAAPAAAPPAACAHCGAGQAKAASEPLPAADAPRTTHSVVRQVSGADLSATVRHVVPPTTALLSPRESRLGAAKAGAVAPGTSPLRGSFVACGDAATSSASTQSQVDQGADPLSITQRGPTRSFQDGAGRSSRVGPPGPCLSPSAPLLPPPGLFGALVTTAKTAPLRAPSPTGYLSPPAPLSLGTLTLWEQPGAPGAVRRPAASGRSSPAPTSFGLLAPPSLLAGAACGGRVTGGLPAPAGATGRAAALSPRGCAAWPGGYSPGAPLPPEVSFRRAVSPQPPLSPKPPPPAAAATAVSVPASGSAPGAATGAAPAAPAVRWPQRPAPARVAGKTGPAPLTHAVSWCQVVGPPVGRPAGQASQPMGLTARRSRSPQ